LGFWVLFWVGWLLGWGFFGWFFLVLFFFFLFGMFSVLFFPCGFFLGWVLGGVEATPLLSFRYRSALFLTHFKVLPVRPPPFSEIRPWQRNLPGSLEAIVFLDHTFSISLLIKFQRTWDDSPPSTGTRFLSTRRECTLALMPPTHCYDLLLNRSPCPVSVFWCSFLFDTPKMHVKLLASRS